MLFCFGYTGNLLFTISCLIIMIKPSISTPPTFDPRVAPQAHPRGQIGSYFLKEDVSKAEILWALQTVTAHNKSNEHVAAIFKAMFPRQPILRAEKKDTAYISVFGLAEDFIGLFKNDVNNSFVILFDESLNKKTQQQQMDIHIRYWKDNQVVSRYLGSEFLGNYKLHI